MIEELIASLKEKGHTDEEIVEIITQYHQEMTEWLEAQHAPVAEETTEQPEEDEDEKIFKTFGV